MIGLADLDAMDRVALLATWSDLFSDPAPKGMSQAFLRRFLAYEIQAQRHGGVPKRIEVALQNVETPKARSRTRSLKPGGRLFREWNGTTHVVEVTADGYLWNGARHRSLSAIARAITGAHWSGPRFFGLNGRVGR